MNLHWLDEARTAERCGEYCRMHADCEVWQFLAAGECWYGQGYSCQLRGGDADFQGQVVAGQRLQHGTVQVLRSLLDIQILDLQQIGLFANGNRTTSIARCRKMCYSDVDCRYWQYGMDGCWLEHAPLYPYQGRQTNNSDFARTVLAGEEIRHDCPDEPAVMMSGGVSVALVWAVALLIGVVALAVVMGWYLMRVAKARKKSSRGRKRGLRVSEEEDVETKEEEEAMVASTPPFVYPASQALMQPPTSLYAMR